VRMLLRKFSCVLDVRLGYVSSGLTVCVIAMTKRSTDVKIRTSF
jgi:hypothetical protein